MAGSHDERGKQMAGAPINAGALRFAFYGRVSTEDQQDPEASRNWQLARSRALTDKHGSVVAEFFDIGSPGRSRGNDAPRLLDFSTP